ncbi:MAG: hypothetical protein COB98_09930 [Flavobacteriaceae bacterium]|nr:MAG: hypothetical protein COB98_09930 [Flavobacteriaceae bacterium]
MDLQAELKWIHRELDNVTDPTLIEVFKNILKYRKKEVQADDNISIEQYNMEIDQSETEIEVGNCYTTDEVRETISKWGRK